MTTQRIANLLTLIRIHCGPGGATDETETALVAAAQDVIDELSDGASDMPKAPECKKACQQAVNYGVDGEHSCSPVCVYLKKPPAYEFGYADAFYEMCGVLGIGARPDTPENVYKGEVLPKLKALASMAARPVAWQVRSHRLVDGSNPWEDWGPWEASTKEKYDIVMHFKQPSVQGRKLYAMDAA